MKTIQLGIMRGHTPIYEIWAVTHRRFDGGREVLKFGQFEEAANWAAHLRDCGHNNVTVARVDGGK